MGYLKYKEGLKIFFLRKIIFLSPLKKLKFVISPNYVDGSLKSEPKKHEATQKESAQSDHPALRKRAEILRYFNNQIGSQFGASDWADSFCIESGFMRHQVYSTHNKLGGDKKSQDCDVAKLFELSFFMFFILYTLAYTLHFINIMQIMVQCNLYVLYALLFTTF